MNAYIYQASLWCEDCAAELRNRLAMGRYESDIAKDDSDKWPQGPYSNGGGEADTPQHCDDCGKFLENPLTADGYDNVAEAIGRRISDNDGRKDTLRSWAEFYKSENSLLDNAIQEWQTAKPEDWESSLLSG